MGITRKTLGMSLLMVVVCMGTSKASLLVNCNFVRGDYGGSIGTGQYGLLGTSSDTWNNIPINSSSFSLQGSTGGNSGLSLSETNFTSSWYNDLSSSPYTILYSYNETNKTDGTAKVTISGFSGGIYDLYVYNTFVWMPAYTTYTVNGTSKVISNQPYNVTSFVEGQNYGVFADVLPVNGAITISVDASNYQGSITGSICALQLVEVPEPVTIGFLAVGGLWLRRRQ